MTPEQKNSVLSDAERLVMDAFKRLKRCAEQQVEQGDEISLEDLTESLRHFQQVSEVETLRMLTSAPSSQD